LERRRCRARILPASVAVATAIGAALAAVSGCGRKGDPLPPQIRRADATRDLAVFQEGPEAVLSWSYPSMTSAGGPLPDLEAVEVWRAPIPLGQEPLGTTAQDRAMRNRLLEAQGEKIALLDAAGLDDATRGPSLTLRDDLDAWRAVHGAEQPVVLWYAVRTFCCGGRPSEYSNIARLVPQLPPAAPQELVARPEREGIRLSWLAAGNTTTIVERSADGQEWTAATAEPVAVPEFLDARAQQGRQWSYRLRAVGKSDGEGRVIGEPGPVVAVDHPDIYPPAPPSDVVCLPEEARISLRWQAARDAAGYRIERRVGGGEWQVLVDLHRGAEFADEAPPAGALTYAVRAVDEAGNRSEPAECAALQGISR
jgi:predicted small lipoprotein YifL